MKEKELKLIYKNRVDTGFLNIIQEIYGNMLNFLLYKYSKVAILLELGILFWVIFSSVFPDTPYINSGNQFLYRIKTCRFSSVSKFTSCKDNQFR
jgi:hypothetical protein